MIVRWIIFPLVCVLGLLACCAVWSQIDTTNDAFRLEQRK